MKQKERTGPIHARTMRCTPALWIFQHPPDQFWQVMHSVNDPVKRPTRSTEQSSRVASGGSFRVQDALVIWDAGLGAGSNAMAALCCFESEWKNSTNAGLLPDRPMRLLSFEHDWIRSNCSWESAGFPLPPRRSHELLKSGMWKHSSGLLSWELIEGDFLETFETAITPDLIFYDPFSFKTDARFWTSDVFSRIFEKLSPKSAELYTYSASTAVRVALLTAGFFVAEGVGMGPKSSTTLAFSQPSGGRTSAGSCTPRPGLARALETQSFKAACRPCRRR